MPRLEDTLTQDAVAESLLGDPQPEQASEEPQSEYSVHGDAWLNEAIDDAAHDVIRFGDEVRRDGVAGLAEEIAAQQSNPVRERQPEAQPEREDWRAENQPVDRFVAEEAARRNAEQAQQGQDSTPEQVRETVRSLDAFNEQHHLADESRTEGFCLALARLGQPLETIDQTELGKGLDRLALNTLKVAEATNDFPSVPPTMATEFCFTILPALQIDPRDPNINHEYVANMLHGASVNFYRTAQAQRSDDVARLNHPGQVAWTYWHLMKAFGRTPVWQLPADRRMEPAWSPEERKIAIGLADAYGRFLLSYRTKVTQAAQHYQPQSPARQASRRPGAQRGARAAMRLIAPKHALPEMQTNNDLYDRQTREEYQRHHGRI